MQTMITSMDLRALPRLQFYAKFVQSIVVHTGVRTHCIHPGLISEFTQAVQFLHSPLFPHLVSLDCVLYGPDATRSSGVWLVTRPSNITLSILDSTEAVYLPVIRSLYHHGASLTSLSLHIGETSGFSEAFNDCFSSVLKQLVNLVCLSADWKFLFTPIVWTCIAQLPSLREINSPFLQKGFRLDIFGSSAWDGFEPPTLETPFPSLHTIEIAIPSQLAVIVLGYYPLGGVRFLRMLLTDEDDPSTEQSLVQIVTMCTGLHGLLLVTPGLKFPVLKLPLSPNLTHLVVCTDGVETINNTDLVNLCSKMPNLEVLGLIPTEVQIHLEDNNYPPGLTLEVIRSIANVCPRLERASLYIDTDVSGSQFSLDDPPLPSNHPLSTLCFAPSQVRNHSEVAMYLCAMFQDAQRTPTIMAPAFNFYDHFIWDGPHHNTFRDSEVEWGRVAELMHSLRRRVIPSFRSRLAQKDAELEALREKLRSYLPGGGSNEGSSWRSFI
ncbi:uncharacterized protein EI90DRAFT_3030012, partial [Cantharellus anzutake]|uniref:uncharacterized protein n=1 Tax=Cantharellus anzutake TaxID=1750568 RepID=UPI001902ECE4